MAKFKVAVSDYVFPDLTPEAAVLSPLDAEVISGQCRDVAELIALAGECDALLNCYFKPVGEPVFAACPKLKIVVRYGIGVDTIDIPAATRRGIMVANVPDYCLDEVSDHTAALVLALARKVTLADRKVKAGDYSLKYLKPLFKLQGKTVGFLGFGRIARLTASKLAVFGFRFLFYDPFISESSAAQAAKGSLEEVLKASDFLLVHAPETPETHHLLNRRMLALMKPTACVVNTARGGLIEIDALVDALQDGKLGGAALDVLEGMPPIAPDHPLCRMENVILTPHSAWYSEDALKALQRMAAEEVARVLKGGRPKSLLNPEVLERKE